MAYNQSLPTVTRALVLRPSSTAKKPVYHDATLERQPLPELKQGQLLVQINAAAYNHRDLWIRKGQYPGTGPGAVFGSDGAGVVVASPDANDSFLSKRVFLTPMRGWESSPLAPESESDFFIVGGSARLPLGTFSDYVVVDRKEVVLVPEHLDDVHAAAWPLGGLTAWRATIVNGQVERGSNVLITGVGGGVALQALQLCIARGANVYVTSGSATKIEKAIALGAKAGFNYKGKWQEDLANELKKAEKKYLDVVIDSGGGNILDSVTKVLKPGGKVVCYGMTASGQIPFTMRAVLKQQQLVGSTMGSRKDLLDATAFLSEHRIVPVVSKVLDGIKSAEEGFDLLQNSDHFGKIVISMRHDVDSSAKAQL